MNWKVYKCGKQKKLLCRTKIVRGLWAQIGLMFKPELKKGDSLLLDLPGRKVDIHTYFVFFPIDLFFLNKKFEVIEKADLDPWKIYYPKKQASYLLEANKGELKLIAGDRLQLSGF